MFQGLEHIGLTARDPEQLAAWYERVLGFRIIFRTDARPPVVFVAGERGMLEILPESGGDAGRPHDPRTHLAVLVDDFEGALRCLRESGVALEGDAIDIFHGGRVVFFRDPEGHRLHLVHRPVAPWA